MLCVRVSTWLIYEYKIIYVHINPIKSSLFLGYITNFLRRFRIFRGLHLAESSTAQERQGLGLGHGRGPQLASPSKILGGSKN